MPKHAVEIEDTRLGDALREKVEDKIAEVFAHHQQSGVAEKPSKITVEIIMTPDSRAEEFRYDISAKVVLAPRKSFRGSVYLRRSREDVLSLTEFDPMQERLDLEEREDQESKTR